MYDNSRHTHGSGSGSGSGPIANGIIKRNNTDRNNNGIQKNPRGSTMPSKSERLNSPNTSKWEPDVRMMMSTNQWLKVHGLKKRKLDMAQILPSIGFRHSDDYVQPLQKPVRARYCKGLFTQVPYRNGSVYNVIASKDKLAGIEEQLKQVIGLYKRRLEWLTTESRRVFGVVEERCISIVLDIDVVSDTQFDTFRHALIQVIKEQVMFISKLNLIRCAADMHVWQDNAVCVTLDSMEDALDWIWKLDKIVPRSSTCTVEAVTKAINDKHVEAVYLFTEGSASDGSSELLKRKVKESQVPIHVVSFNCNSPSMVTFFKQIAKETLGRFHAFSVNDEYNNSSFQNTLNDGDSDMQNGRGRGDGMPSLKLGIGVREDVIALWQELDEARNALAEIQALQVELSDPKSTPISTAPPPKDNSQANRPKPGSRSELYMSSKDWLKHHGLKSRKLGFYELLQTLAFKHCDGVVDIQQPPTDNGLDAIVRPKLVNARYCDKFAHVRWKDGTIMHVHVSGPVHRNFEQRMLSALDSYKKRIEWLQQGSRELFGTVIEDQVTILIDTSASMASRLFLVKDKLYRLMQEQLRHKVKFNLMKFDTKVQAWRDRLVDCSTHNLDNAWQWVKGLSTGGSTNTLAALKQALSDSQCRGIYLLTDGRPDQPPTSIHAQVHLLDPVPIHTISFNCADSEANEFLCQLAEATNARFHYFSEDGYDIHGPKPFESEDLRLLREEIEKGLSDMKKIAMLRNECAQLDWYGSNNGRCSKSHSMPRSGPKRPASAKNRMVPSPPNSMRPSSARTRPASAGRSISSSGIRHSSFKDYIVSDAVKDIPSPKQNEFVVAETRASQMRLNIRKQTKSDWMLSETREYLTKNNQDYKKTKVRTKKKKKPKVRQEDDDIRDVSVKQWLKEHGLVARKLTILDALSPTMIPHTTKYVPILDKHVLSKVFDQVLPLAHTSGSNRDEVQLVNPQAVNLKAYESKLDEAIQLYTRKLDEMVYFGLSDQERVKYPEDRVPSFSQHRESMLKDLEDQGWQVRREDVMLMEKEIEQANTFLVQSQDLRKASEQAAKDIAEEQRRARQEMENKRIEKIMSKSAPTTASSTQPTPQGNKFRLRHHKVVARNEVDGFYYPGLVRKCVNPRYVEIDFDGFERQVVGVRYVIPIEGARPCPSLKVGDYVLVRTPIPREETDDILMDRGYCYVPGIVQVVPLRRATASKCFTVLRFNGKKITSIRKDLIKISKARYTFACRYIRDALISAYKASCPFGLYPNGVDEGKELIAVNKGKQKPESPRSRSSSSSSDQSEQNDDPEDPPTNRSRPESRSDSASSRSRSGSGSGSRSSSRSRSRSRSRSPSPSQSDDSSAASDEDGGPPTPTTTNRRSKSPTDTFEDLKKELDEKHATQLKEIREQREKLEQLQQQLADEQTKQKQQQDALEQKQKDLQDQQDKLVQAQIDEHKERQNRLQEEQKRLQEQQEELLKKQKDQQEQLLMQQYSQTQSLQLQQQQLMQVLASGQPKKEQESDTKSRDNTPVTSPRRTPRHSTHTTPKRSPVPSPRDQSSKRSSPKSSRPSSSKRSSRKPSFSGEKEDESASDSDSSSSSNSASSKHSSTKEGHDDIDGRKDPKPEEEGPPDIKFHVSDNNEACLLTKGSHGLLISRLPPDVDPAIETRHFPKRINEGDEVLARWADEGWYYRGTVRQECDDGTFFVEDSVGDLEQIPRADIITDEDDADNVIKEGDPIVGLHPSFSYSYAPGVVISLEDNNMYQVRYYDGIEAMVPREEIYSLPADKFEADCAYILACEESLVGQAVVARNDDDGTFHLGTVRERVGNGRQYIIEWADQSVQLQSSGYIFGAHTKRHPLSIGDRVLALADPATYMYVPGWITGSNGRRLVVKFCNGKSSSHVDPLQCFWLSRDYFDRVVEFFKKRTSQEEQKS